MLKISAGLLTLIFFISLAGNIHGGVAGYSGKLEESDRKLVEHFMKKAALYGNYGRYREILLELKTAEKILNKRSKPLVKKLAKAYLKAAQGFLFYFNYNRKHKAEFLLHAEYCLKSAHALDRSNFGELYRFMVALKRQKAEVYFAQRNLRGLSRIQKQLRSMDEDSSGIVLKQKILRYRAAVAKKQAVKKNMYLVYLEKKFVYALGEYKQHLKSRSSSMYLLKFVDTIRDIINTIPRPPGGTYFLHQMSKKYSCHKELMIALRKKNSHP